MLGLTDEVQENEFRWSDGNPTSFTYFNAGQPDGGTGQNCWSLHEKKHGKWHDIDCTILYAFICKAKQLL